MIVSATVLSPCKDCREREPHCHSKCDKYKAYKDKLEVNRTRYRLEADTYLFSQELKAKIAKRYLNRRDDDK